MIRNNDPATDKQEELRAATAKRQRRRIARLNAAAQSGGFSTWRRLETAVLNGRARVIYVEEEEE